MISLPSILTSFLLVFPPSIYCSNNANVAVNTPNPLPTPTLDSSSNIVATANLAGSFGVTGQIQFTLGSAVHAVDVKVSLSGLMALNSSAQYAYHLHTNPISSDGNCSSALGHLDPLQVTDAIVCNPLVPQYCEVGDLSGRNGKLLGNSSVLNLTYTDRYLRFWPQPFSLLGRSVVIHAPNSTRIACGNITSTLDGTADSQGHPTNKSSTYVTEYPSRAPPTNGAKLEPFVGTLTASAVLATMTLPASLPDVEQVPNAYLTVQPLFETINNKVMTATLAAAIPASTNYDYSPGSHLPSQDDLTVPNSAPNNTLNGTDSSNNTQAAKQASVASERLTLPAAYIIGIFILGINMLL